MVRLLFVSLIGLVRVLMSVYGYSLSSASLSLEQIKKCTDIDNINANIVRKIAKYRSSVKLSTRTSSTLFMKGIVPTKLKIAKVIPLYKCDNPELFQNY